MRWAVLPNWSAGRPHDPVAGSWTPGTTRAGRRRQGLRQPESGALKGRTARWATCSPSLTCSARGTSARKFRADAHSRGVPEKAEAIGRGTERQGSTTSAAGPSTPAEPRRPAVTGADPPPPVVDDAPGPAPRPLGRRNHALPRRADERALPLRTGSSCNEISDCTAFVRPPCGNGAPLVRAWRPSPGRAQDGSHHRQAGNQT